MSKQPYYAAYSTTYAAWSLYKRMDELTSEILWPCNNEKAARELAKHMNNGGVICRGSKALGSACGKCMKCQCVRGEL